MTKVTTLKEPSISLPETWENTRVAISFPDSETLVVKRLPSLSKGKSFNSDDEVWKDIKEDYEKTQEDMFKEKYPDLYAKLQGLPGEPFFGLSRPS